MSKQLTTCRFASLAVLLLLPCFLASCASQGGIAHLDPIAPLNPLHNYNPYAPQSPLSDSVAKSWTLELQQEFADPNFFKTMDSNADAVKRNTLAYQMIGLCDYRFAHYEYDLVLGKAKRDTFTDLSMFGLNSAASLMTPGSATQIISAIAAGLGFSRSNIEKNFFQNQATPALLDRMEVLRKAKYNEIVPKLGLPYSQYPAAALLKDMNDYFNAGTMIGALRDVKQNTAIKDIETEGGTVTLPPVVKKQAAPPVVKITPPVIEKKVIEIRTAKLTPDVRARRKVLGDRVVVLAGDKDGEAKATEVLKKLNITPTQGEAVVTLREKISDVQTSDDLKPLETAFGITPPIVPKTKPPVLTEPVEGLPTKP